MLKRVPSVSRVVTATTRPPRPGEKEGIDYYFLSPDEFDARRERGDFLEWAQVHGNYYATPRTDVERKLSEGFDVVLVIDVQGAAEIKKRMPDSVLIFIAPPSAAELVKRLTGRDTESEQERRRRLAAAETEMALSSNYDYVIVNDKMESAARELVDVVNRVKNE